MQQVIIFLVVTVVLPIVINKTTERGRFDFVHPYLRVMWTGLLVFGIWYLLSQPFALEFMMAHRGWKFTYLVVFLIGGTLLCGFWWITGLLVAEKSNSPTTAAENIEKSETVAKTPSLVFLFGAPLGNNRSSTWVMMLKHFGPEPAFNCRISFVDEDRKNLEHQWLANHPDSPFLPEGCLMNHKSGSTLLRLSRLSWKWRKRSSVKIAERTYEQRAQALHC